MASLPTKKVVRTYARQKRSLYDEQPPTKRRRVECVEESSATQASTSDVQTAILIPSHFTRSPSELPSSSPKNAPAIWSDDAPRSSPPSSPTQEASPPPLQKRRPVFSFLKKNTTPTAAVKQPLSERSHNAQSPKEPVKAKKPMVQMQLDLASETRKACKTCGMEYIPSNAEDAALHKKFHAMNVGGVDLTKATVERLRKTQVWSGGDDSFIVVIGRKDALALRNRTSDVLKVVNTELAAVPISDEELWSQTAESLPVNARTANQDTDAATAEGHVPSSPAVDRFKVYLYVRSQKCIGVCLAERISEAYTVLDQNNASAQTRQLSSERQSSSISISTSATPAMLGISRIWTSNQHRKQGVATRLLECARLNFLYGLRIEKNKVAFSQPTESGGNLARKWFARQAGWHVYTD